MTNRMQRFPIALTMTFLAALAVAPVAHGQTQSTSTMYGATYGELAARWWEWALSIPAGTNPLIDATGANCAVGQSGRVWFLAGTLGGTANRACTVPAGKAIFFPIINLVAFSPAPTETTLDLRRQAADFVDAAKNLKCTLDGHPCPANLSDLRAQSPIFEVIVRAGGLLDPGTYNPMVADGYWLLLTPLPPGQHVLKFGGTSGSTVVDVTFHLTVGQREN